VPLDLTNVACVGASSALFVAEVVVAYKTARGGIPPRRGVLALLAISRGQALLLKYVQSRGSDSYEERQHKIAEQLRSLVRARESERLFRSPTTVTAGRCSIHGQAVETDGVCRVCRYKNRTTGGAYLARQGTIRTVAEVAAVDASVEAVARAFTERVNSAQRPQPRNDGSL
jgi:hypothetical protein